MFATALQETLHQQIMAGCNVPAVLTARTVPWFVGLCVDACL
jgi:hypothetical protein